jgi:hypothetical protein
MVVDEFDVFRTFIRPYEANPPLVVHSDRVLPGSVTPEGLQTVARGAVRSFKLVAAFR